MKNLNLKNLIKYCLHRYKTQEMCEKAVNANLPTSKFVPDWFLTPKILEDLDNIAFFDDNMIIRTLIMMILIMVHSLMIILIILRSLILML